MIGDGESFVALAMRFLERGEGVAGFARLREDEDAGMTQIDIAWAPATTVLARVFNVDRQAAKIFEQSGN